MKVRSNSASSSTRSTTRTAWSSCASARLRTTRRPSARATAPRTRDTSAVSRRSPAQSKSTLDAQSNAQRLGTALGLPGADIAPVLASVGGGSDRHEVDLRSMNTALWQATWGYFLTNMIGMDGTGLTPETTCVGARALRRARSQRRTVPAVALWQAAVRCSAGHVARLLASARRRGSRECARHVAQDLPAQPARQRVAPAP